MLVDRAARETVELPVARETLRDLLEQIRRQPAVVVRERNDVGFDFAERRVACACEPARRSQPLDVEPRMRVDDPDDAVVLVLIDEQDAKVAMALLFERCEQKPELFASIDRRDDEVE